MIRIFLTGNVREGGTVGECALTDSDILCRKLYACEIFVITECIITDNGCKGSINV